MPLGRITGEIFKQYNIVPSTQNNDYDVYIPCGYNNVESELLKVENAKNKFVFGEMVVTILSVKIIFGFY